MANKQLSLDDLDLTPADPHSPVPLYHQIYLDLKNMIQTGRIPVDAVLPAELQLCRAYGVGRHTMRMAISGLVDDKLVERFPGRGTFVNNQAHRLNFYLDRSFSQQMREMGYNPHSKLLKVELGQVNEDSPRALQKMIGAACLRLERLRFGDDIPISIQSTTVLTEKCAGIEMHDFAAQSLYEVLAREYHLPIVQIQHVVRAVAATPQQAEILGVSIGVPLLFVATTAFLENRELIECSESYYRADLYEYSTTQKICD
jgi:GntR family transcriptional regulator, N-acetylglucosamine utilization regulator